METDEIFKIGFGDELASVTFGLYVADDITAADGTVIPADGLVEIISIDKDGKGVSQTDLPFGSYYLQERTTNNQYLLGSEKYPVTFSYAGQDTAVVNLAVNDGKDVYKRQRYP